MSREIYTIEDERKEYEEMMRDMGYYLNHNYFRAERGIRPYLQMVLNGHPGYISWYFGLYSLLFADDQLVLLSWKYLDDESKEHILKIDYKDISDFYISRPFIKYCIAFKANGKRYYFYIDGNGAYSFSGLGYSARNFRSLLDNNFKGLMK